MCVFTEKHQSSGKHVKDICKPNARTYGTASNTLQYCILLAMRNTHTHTHTYTHTHTQPQNHRQVEVDTMQKEITPWYPT